MQVRQREGNHIHHRDLGDFDIVVEESFWHREHVTGSTIVMEKISQEVRHAVEKLAMQSVMQKSARKKQHKFREGNIVKIQNTHQVEMEWVNMVTTKLVEWADKVVYNTVRKALDMVYMMQMIESFIHQYEEYTRKVDCLRKEVFMMNLENLVAIVEVVGTVFNVMKHNMEEFTFQKGDISMIEDTNTGIVVDFKSVEVVGTVIIVGKMNIMIEGYVMQKEKLTVQGGDINKFEAIHMMDAVIIKFVEVVINEEEYNMAEVYEELTVEEGDIYMFEDIHMRNVHIVKFMEVAKKGFYNGKDRRRRREDFWSFRDMETRLCLILEGVGVS